MRVGVRVGPVAVAVGGRGVGWPVGVAVGRLVGWRLGVALGPLVGVGGGLFGLLMLPVMLPGGLGSVGLPCQPPLMTPKPRSVTTSLPSSLTVAVPTMTYSSRSWSNDSRFWM